MESMVSVADLLLELDGALFASIEELSRFVCLPGLVCSYGIAFKGPCSVMACDSRESPGVTDLFRSSDLVVVRWRNRKMS
jgi:hypothetical protein